MWGALMGGQEGLSRGKEGRRPEACHSVSSAAQGRVR